MRRLAIFLLSLTLASPALAHNTWPDTHGRCPAASSCEIGNASTTSIFVDTDGIDLNIDGNATNTLSLQNSATGSVIMDFRDYADTTDDDMAHSSLITNCTTTTPNAEDCDFTIQVVNNGRVITRITVDGDGNNVFPPAPAFGSNAGFVHKLVGIPKISPFAIATGKAASETVNTDFGDSQTPNTDWTQTTNITTADDTTIWRKVSASLKLTVGAAPVAGNGADNALSSGDQDWSADESFGLWVSCSKTFAAGDWVLGITDNASEDVTTGFLEYTEANTWVWMELEIGSISDGDKDVITDLAIDLSTAGAVTFTGGGTCNFDGMWKWDAAEENALGLDIYEEGLFSVMSIVKATGGNRIPKLEVEETDYFVHYEAGNDFFVSITGFSNDVLWGLAAEEP